MKREVDTQWRQSDPNDPFSTSNSLNLEPGKKSAQNSMMPSVASASTMAPQVDSTPGSPVFDAASTPPMGRGVDAVSAKVLGSFELLPPGQPAYVGQEFGFTPDARKRMHELKI